MVYFFHHSFLRCIRLFAGEGEGQAEKCRGLEISRWIGIRMSAIKEKCQAFEHLVICCTHDRSLKPPVSVVVFTILFHDGCREAAEACSI
jgi:hypothetical protein